MPPVSFSTGSMYLDPAPSQLYNNPTQVTLFQYHIDKSYVEWNPNLFSPLPFCKNKTGYLKRFFQKCKQDLIHSDRNRHWWADDLPNLNQKQSV